MASLTVGGYDLLDFLLSPATLITGADLGSAPPDTVAVARLLLDGDIVTGTRYGNRLVVLPVLVRADDVGAVAQIVSDLAATVAQTGWQMTWTSAAGEPPVTFDCFRGTVEQQWNRIGMAPAGAAASGLGPQTSAPAIAVTSGAHVTLTLTFPALPFTRDQSRTVLAGVAPPAPVVLDELDTAPGSRTTGLPWVNPYNEWRELPGGGGVTGPGFGGDTPAASLSASSSHVTGTGSIRVLCPVSPIITYSDSGARAETGYAPLTLGKVLAAPIDLSAAARVEFYARTNAGRTTTPGPLRPYTVGVNPADLDDASVQAAVRPGVWVLTLTDDTGAVGSWLVAAPIDSSSGWSFISINLASHFISAPPTFRYGYVAAWRLRYYAVGVKGSNTVTSTELYTSALLPSDPVDRSNLSIGAVNGVEAAWTGAADVHVFAAGDAEGAWPTNVVVTAGQVYSGRVGIRQPPDATAAVTLRVRCGIEWLTATGGTSLGINWGASTGSTFIRSFQPVRDKSTWFWLSEPTCPNVTAPAGATRARIRIKLVGSPAGTEQAALSAPRICPGPIAWRFPYADTVGVTLFVDHLTAGPAAGGVFLTAPYGLTTIPAVAGVARTPASVAVTADVPVTRLLIARTPKPPPGFTPFLDTPSSAPAGSGPTANAGALTGQHYLLADGSGPTSYVLAFDRTARAYDGTYALIVRAKRGNTQPATISATANLAGDLVNITACQRTWDNTGVDLDAWPLATWRLLTVGVLNLPPRAVDGANSAITIQIKLTGVVGGGLLYFDMATLVDLSGESVLLSMPDSEAMTYLWLDAPEQADGAGTIVGGAQSDRSDAISLSPWQYGQAVLQLDALNDNAITLVLDKATGGNAALSFYPRWLGARPS